MESNRLKQIKCAECVDLEIHSRVGNGSGHSHLSSHMEDRIRHKILNNLKHIVLIANITIDVAKFSLPS